MWYFSFVKKGNKKMKKSLSLLIVTTLTASIPAPLLANTTTISVKRNVEVVGKDVTTGLEIKMDNIKDLNLNWKTIKGTFYEEFKTRNNKLYIMFAKEGRITDAENFKIIKFKNDDIDKPLGNVWNNIIKLVEKNGLEKYYSVKELYRWEGTLEPITLPLIDIKIGKVINWNDTTPFQNQISFSIADYKNGYWLKHYQLVINGQVKVKIANINIDTVKVNGTKMSQTNKVWEFNLPIDITTIENKDYKIEVAFTIDGKSYMGQIIVSSLLAKPSINVKKNTSVIGAVNSYVYQAPINDKVGDIKLTSDLYYSDAEIKVSLNKPTGSTNITAQIFGLDEKGEKNKKVYQIFDNQTHNLDGNQLETYQGWYLIETKDNTGNKNSYYVVVNKYNLTPNFWDTKQGQTFYRWVSLNGYNENIKKLNATELNKIIKDSENWKKLASDSQFADYLAGWFKTKGKLVSKEPLTDEKVIAQLKTQIPISIPIADTNTSNYDPQNKIVFELNKNKFKPNEKVNIVIKYETAKSDNFNLQIENNNLPNNNKAGLTGWAIVGIIVGALSWLFLFGWLFKKFVVTPYILKTIRKKRRSRIRTKMKKAKNNIN